jgi:hypothetical protein
MAQFIGTILAELDRWLEPGNFVPVGCVGVPGNTSMSERFVNDDSGKSPRSEEERDFDIAKCDIKKRSVRRVQ